MKVLGISPLDKDSTVTIVEDGAITFAAAEERFTRIKLQDGFPWRALQAGLESTGIEPADIEVVTYPFFTWEEETAMFRRNLDAEREFIDEGAASAGQNVQPLFVALVGVVDERLFSRRNAAEIDLLPLQADHCTEPMQIHLRLRIQRVRDRHLRLSLDLRRCRQMRLGSLFGHRSTP